VRVTDSMIFDRAIASCGAARDRAQQATDEACSGLRVVHPGDDPPAAGLSIIHRQRQAREESILASTQRANDELSSADGALNGLGNLLSRARELAVQMSNATYSANERTSAAQEASSLLQGAIALLNTEAGGRYLFGGNQDGSPPFDATGNYLGDSAVRQVEVAPSVLQAVSLRADVIAKGAGGGTDVLATLQALSTALAANDVPGVQATLTGLDASIQQVAAGRAQAGTAMTVLDSAAQVASTARDASKEAVSHELEADTIESASKLALAQRALEAALSASAQSFQLTLLDKLG
jgi:flagellar hook-associated protein 3 FlgL